MDKMSFASVYRTAAILAAFSRGDGSADEPARRGETPAVVIDLGPPVRPNASLWHILQLCLTRMFRRSPGAPDDARWDSIDLHATGWWVLQRRPVASVRPEAQGSPLVSHFAFSETAELHSVETGS